MSKNKRFEPKVGRPIKTPLARKKTCLWAIAVRIKAGADSFRGLEERLGEDGKWEGMWSRYERGLVVPSRKRMMRIEERLPETICYFDAGFWQLLESRPYTWEELDQAIKTLPSSLFFNFRRLRGFGRITLSNPLPDVLNDALMMVRNDAYGNHGLFIILLLLREAELAQDSWQYLHAMKAWASASEEKNWNPVLRYLPNAEFLKIAKTLQYIEFQDDINWYWGLYRKAYFYYRHRGREPRIQDFNGLDLILRFYVIDDVTEEILRNIMRCEYSEIVPYLESLKLSWGRILERGVKAGSW